MATVKRTNPTVFKVLSDHLKELDGKVAKAGWFASSVYPNKTPVAYVAIIQEYGYAEGNIPPRPFMRPTVARETNEWRALMLSGSKAILKGNATLYEVMNGIGGKAAGDVAKTISQVFSPPLKPKTILARARRKAQRVRGKPLITGTLQKPLVDTALMINTVTHVVEDA